MNTQYLVSFRAKKITSSHVKITCYVKIAPFDAQPLIHYYLFVIDLYTINRILHGHLEIPNFYSRVEKYINMRNVVSPRSHVISSIQLTFLAIPQEI